MATTEKKDKNIKDKEVQTTGYENRGEDFQKNLELKEYVYDTVKDLTNRATDLAFGKLGIKRVEKPAGYYATGEPYGTGVVEDGYGVRYMGKTKSIIQKQIIFGTKRIETDIKMVLSPGSHNTFTVEYNGTEKAIFKGHTSNIDDPKGFMVKDTITVSTDDKAKLKKDLRQFLNRVAEKEADYLITSKIGIDDRLETTLPGSIVQESTEEMKDINYKNLLDASADEIAEMFTPKETLQEAKDNLKNIDSDGDEVEMNHQDVVDANTQGGLLFDDLTEEQQNDYQQIFSAIMNKDYPGKELDTLSKDEKNDISDKVEDIWASEETRENALAEIATAGALGAPGTAGAFQYATPKAFKDSPYMKAQEGQPKVKKKKNEGDSFWTTVDTEMLKDTHPLGMPGVKLGSKEELDNATGGGAASTKFWKNLNEGKEIIPQWEKKKFVNEAENKEQGINKRYIIGVKPTQEQLNERWEKLSMFDKNETIRNAEEVVSEEDIKAYNEYLNECGCGDTYLNGDAENQMTGDEYEDYASDEFEEENGAPSESDMIMVQKSPESFVVYKFMKEQFENSNKMYILDYVTNEYVTNPNWSTPER